MDADRLRRRIAMEYARQMGAPIFPPLLDALVDLANEYAEDAGGCGSSDCILLREPLL